MIIQSRIQQMRQTAASSAWTDDEADDDPWSGYGDTLEMELNTAPTQPAAEPTTATATTTTASPATQTYTQTVDASGGFEDEFAAAGARLQQRGQDLHQQHLQRSARRQVPQYFAHLEQGYGYGVAGRGYAPTHYYTPAPAPIQYAPHHQPHHHSPSTPPPATVPQVITMEPDPLAPQPPALPYEIDAYGNPILPEGMELDAWGNLVPSNDYYRS